MTLRERANEGGLKLPLRLFGHHRIESRILILFLAVAGIGFALVGTGGFTLDRTILTGLRQAGDLTQPIAPDWVTRAMVDITALGGVTVLTLVTIFAVGFLFFAGRHRAALFVALSVGAGAIATRLLKLLIERARPDIVPHLVPVDSASFPSSHAMNGALVYLTLAMLMARTNGSRAIRIYLISAAILLTLLIGASRVYLGVHWPSDILAGWGVGGLWALLSTLAFKAWLERQPL